MSVTSMGDVAFTKMSSKGQIVIPKALRELLGIKEGEMFALFGEDDTIIMKRVELPTGDELEAILKWGSDFARRKGIKRRDVLKAIEAERKGRA
jgi:antitoxin PrlF